MVDPTSDESRTARAILYDATLTLTDYDGAWPNVTQVSSTNYSSGGVHTSSDSSLKDIISDTTLTVEQVANAPAVNFTWKGEANRPNKKENVGTIAQYWQVILPQVITEDKQGYLSMNYSNAAMVSSIVTAKEVVALKEQVAELQRQIEELKNK